MFFLIEMDRSFTFGIDWNKKVKGIRLGFIALHIGFISHDQLIGTISEYYHRQKFNQSMNLRDQATDGMVH